MLQLGQRVAVVTQDNKRGDWLELAEAVRDGRAYMGQVDPEVLALDCDPTERPQAADGVLVVREALERYALQCVLDSGREGHQHLFARVRDPTVRAELAALAQSRGLDVRQVIRLPLSPHRLGHPVRLREPAMVEEAAGVLARRSRRPLNPHMQRVLETGLSHHYSNSDRLQALCTAMVQADWTPGEAFQELRDHPVGESLRRVERQGRDPYAYFLTSWRTAAAYVRDRPALAGPQEATVELAALRERVQRHPWPGAQGATQRMVLTALIDIALRVGSVEVNASDRQLVEATSRSRPKAIRGARQALEGDGWLRRTRVGTDSKGSTYRLNVHAGVTTAPPNTSLIGGA